MTSCSSRTALITLILAIALPAWSQQYFLYAPQPVDSVENVPTQNGILVQEIEVHKGDTLSAISRKITGHGMYYPQILLFNSIKNPNLIYAGTTLKVPVSNTETNSLEKGATKSYGASHKKKTAGDKAPQIKSEAPVRPTAAPAPLSRTTTEIPLPDIKAAGTVKSAAKQHNGKTPAQEKKNLSTDKPAVPHKNAPSELPAGNSAAAQKLFEAAVKSYKQNDCRKALELLDRYLVDNSGSPLAADANLYKADCYLKLSTQ